MSKVFVAAGAKDVRISGGGNAVLQYLHAGRVDELHLALAPVFLAEGVRLFEGVDARKVALEIVANRAVALRHASSYAVKTPVL